MKKFLTLKNWQLFGLIVGSPIVFQFLSFSNNGLLIRFYYIPIMTIVFGGIFLGWFYALGTNLHKKLPPTVTMNLTRFKIFLFIPTVYILLFSIFVTVGFSNVFTEGDPNPAILSFIVILHLFSMFCLFYCLYFNAKVLKAVEWQRPVTFSDFAGEFFLIWFFPFGIWIVQPRINKLFETTIDNNMNDIQ